MTDDKPVSVNARLRDWAQEIIEDVAKQRQEHIDKIKLEILDTDDNDKIQKMKKSIADIKTSYVDIASELIMIGSMNLIEDNAKEYYVKSEIYELRY